MATTARSESEKKEYFDPPDVLERKVDLLVQWIRESKHMIAFTVSLIEKNTHCRSARILTVCLSLPPRELE